MKPAAACLDLWSLLACPECRGSLERHADAVLVCCACSTRYASEEGKPSLVPPAARPRLDRFVQSYRQARLDEGWTPLSRSELLRLPEGAPHGYPPLYWPVRRQTYQRLLTFLDDVSPRPRSSPAADLGAGTGWLSFRLAQRGHPTLALDASLDADFGLGASFPYASRYPDRILPVRADLDVLPLRPGGLDLILFNASLHYAGDVRATLRRAVSALAPGGRLLILDTPIYFRPSAAPANGERQLGRIELLEELEAAGLETQTLHLFRGFRWLAYQARHLLRRGNPFSFPLLIGTKPSEGGE